MIVQRMFFSSFEATVKGFVALGGEDGLFGVGFRR